MGYLYGGNTGVKTAAELQREREIVDALIARGQRPPQNLGEGLSTLGQAIASRMRRNRLEKDEAAGKEAGSGLMAQLFPEQSDSPTITPQSEIEAGPLNGGMSPYTPEPSLAGTPYPTHGPETPPGPADWQQGEAMPVPEPMASPMPTGQPMFPKTENTLENMNADQLTRFMADPRFEHMPPIVQQMVAEQFKRKSAPQEPMTRLLVGEEATRLGLPSGAYNLAPDGKISAIGGGDTNVNINNADPNAPMMGTIPPGYAAVKDPTSPSGFRMEQIGGGPAALEAEAAAAKAGTAQTNKENSAAIVTQDIDRAIAALNEPGWLPKTGFGAETLKGYGGTGAADLSGLLSSVEANIGFDALQAMRAASPTGGALGSITERELALLAATKGAITQSQSKEQLEDNLNRLWNVTQDIVHGPNAGPQRRKLRFEGGGQNNLKSKYGLE
jgi:hypothetical protein